MNKTLQEAFDIEEFKKKGHQLIDQLAEHLYACKEGAGKVLEYISPDDEYAYWKKYDIDSISGYFADVINRNIHVHHKNYIGHQVSAPAPLAALGGLISDLLNDGMGIYEMGAAATAIERVVVEEFSNALGYPSSASGVLTSGGTLANLTALLGARSHFHLKHSDKDPVILVSDQAHYCIERAAMTMGLSPKQVVKISSNEDFAIDINMLKTTLSEIQARGQKVMAIVACGCSTSTGTYDDIPALARICKEENIWLHIDGAHGGAVIFSTKYKSLAAGFNEADSIIIDAHKMMLTPALATAVLFKEPAHSYRALEVEASYLFEGQAAEWYNLTKRTYETTKYMMSIKIFLLMRYYGNTLFDEFVTSTYDLARQFYQLIDRHPGFEAGHQPMSNIICFRFSNPPIDKDEAVIKVRKQLLLSGKFYIVQTRLKGHYYFRITIMSPFTTLNELEELIRTLSIMEVKLGK